MYFSDSLKCISQILKIICFLGAAQWGLPTGRDLLTGPPGGLEIFAINDRYGAEHQRRDTSFNAPTILCSFVQCVCLCACKYLVFSKAFRHRHVSSIFVCAQLRLEECNALGKQEEYLYFWCCAKNSLVTNDNFCKTKVLCFARSSGGFFSGGNCVSWPQQLVMGR